MNKDQIKNSIKEKLKELNELIDKLPISRLPNKFLYLFKIEEGIYEIRDLGGAIKFAIYDNDTCLVLTARDYNHLKTDQIYREVIIYDHDKDYNARQKIAEFVEGLTGETIELNIYSTNP
jgi:hypothetical protein